MRAKTGRTASAYEQRVDVGQEFEPKSSGRIRSSNLRFATEIGDDALPTKLLPREFIPGGLGSGDTNRGSNPPKRTREHPHPQASAGSPPVPVHLVNGLFDDVHAGDDGGRYQRLPLPVLHKGHLGFRVANIHELQRPGLQHHARVLYKAAAQRGPHRRAARVAHEGLLMGPLTLRCACLHGRHS